MMAMIFGGGEIVVMLMVLCAIAIGILSFVFWICMLVSAIQNPGLGEGEKIGWVLVIALLHVLGAVVYYFIGRPKRHLASPAI
ncbi:MAG TPA: PLDc N-terminal domain-containing protein [Verrucomicrobiae bacterium]|nr:PLDc N-terminal domain-containing protein [Verrucomicrobiae bacterium]